ncbi:MAG: hypothetical protein A2113_04385 [Candidatus Woykebacteria bacterium GWA1_44_8]|uniref:Peptidase M50 domain-containing protein n=1 Tax=Candidatus Woykebacteria bacterium GWA1_44_8 TaxID=1802591 RepID=A0A1G1W1D0_9BACT|nr:MAG: hypothetical protein A2113_04385 [Candidatus Woykebacteria bacterium GWA1_44_8]
MFTASTTDPAVLFFTILSFLIVIGLVISVHEAAHAFFANLRGDPTARLMGRMTLNPVAHIDPLGTIVVPLFLLIFGGFIFGWAKPTPVNPLNFPHPRKDSAIVALAGPVSNLLLAIAFAFLFRLFQYGLLSDVVRLNLMLGIFNLLPIPPLDGFKVVMGALPKRAALSLASLEAYGPAFLMIFLFLFLIAFSRPLIAIISALTAILTGIS